MIKCKIVFCENTQEERFNDGISVSYLNVLPQLAPVNIPGNYTFFAACQLIYDNDMKQPQIMQAIFLDPFGNTVSEICVNPFPSIYDENGLLVNMHFNFEFRNVILPCEGTYVLNVLIDGEQIHSDSIGVRKGNYK